MPSSYSRRTGGLVFHFASFGLHQVLLQPRICRLLVWSFFTNFLLICKIFRKYVPGGFCYREWNKLLDEALLSPDVRLSVSCAFMYCFQTAEDIVKLPSRPDSPIILFDPSARTQLHGIRNPFSGGAKYTGVGKISNFRLKSPSRKRYEIGPRFLCNVNRKS